MQIENRTSLKSSMFSMTFAPSHEKEISYLLSFHCGFQARRILATQIFKCFLLTLRTWKYCLEFLVVLSSSVVFISPLWLPQHNILFLTFTAYFDISLHAFYCSILLYILTFRDFTQTYIILLVYLRRQA